MNSRRICVVERIQGPAVIVSVSGDPVARSEVAPLRRKLGQLASSGVRTVVIDLSRLNLIGAAMLGELIRGLTTVRNAGGDLKLSGVSGRVDKTLRTTRLSGVLKKAHAAAPGPGARTIVLSDVA